MADKATNTGIVYNMLAANSRIKGDFTSDSDFRIDGVFEGTINCKGKVVIGATASLVGTLICHNAEIMGSVDGTISVDEMLILKSTSKVKGDIHTDVLMIEPKAIFCGTCDMERENQ